MDRLRGPELRATSFESWRSQQVFLRGRLVAENGRFVGERGMGRWQKCKPYGLCYDYYHK